MEKEDGEGTGKDGLHTIQWIEAIFIMLESEDCQSINAK